MEIRNLNYSEISAEEISDITKYTNDEYVTWQRINKINVPKRESSPMDTPEYESKVRKAFGLPREGR